MVEAKTHIIEELTHPVASSKSTATLDRAPGHSEETESTEDDKVKQISCENGIIRYNVMGSTFELPEQFKRLRLIGSGAYGVVVAVEHVDDEGKFAIKKIEKAF
jgi:serine/threonine protein kinase